MSQTKVREIIIDRFKEDLIGPVDGINEELFKDPDYNYHSGKLYPTGEDINEIDKDDMNEGFSTKSTSHDFCDDQVKKFKQVSSMGLSCMLNSEKDPTINIEINFGFYIKSSVVEENEDGESKEINKWDRKQFTNNFQLKLDDKYENFSGDLECKILSSLVDDYPGYFYSSEVIPRLHLKTRSIDKNKTSFSIFFINGSRSSDVNKVILFQTKLSVSSDSQIFLELKNKTNEIYTKNLTKTYSTGHTASTKEFFKDGEIEKISTSWVPEYFHADIDPDGNELMKNIDFFADELSEMKSNDLIDKFKKLASTYKDWLENEKPKNPSKLQEDRFKEIGSIIQRFNSSIDFLEKDKNSIKAFQLANKTILLSSKFANPERKFKWRPFQIGFFLLSIESILNKKCKYRDIVDLLWFPTGGGKTEAYLLLTATLLFYRRLKKGGLDKADSTAMFTRYTLRALTVDQFNRLATMVVCAEFIRRRELGLSANNDLKNSFSIGLYLGGLSTPNKVKDTDPRSNSSANTDWKNIYTECPCCKSKMAWRLEGNNWNLTHPENIEECELSKLIKVFPVKVIDEEIYKYPPSVLIGTIDKFVQIFRKPNLVKNLFGLKDGLDPPDLIIQDELHLISGPLGSMAGAIEHIIDEYADNPKIIASTATIQDAPEQILGLYERGSCLFPLDFTNPDDSFFSVKKKSSTGRIYIGVTTATSRSPTYLLQLCSAIQMQSIQDKRLERYKDFIDPYTTPVFYFNSLREIGVADGLLKDDAIASMEAYSTERKESLRKKIEFEELSSNTESKEIVNIRARLEKKYGNKDHLSGLLATVMISVGLDISRLGLMTIVGQPKTISEYIQASSRVGRGDVPGLVITLFNEFKPRDKSYFETFNSWNQDMYSEVESSGVTPYAARAREKILPALLVGFAVKELNLYEVNDFSISESDAEKIKKDVLPKILSRISKVDSSVRDEANKELLKILDIWKFRRKIPHLWSDSRPEHSLLMSAEAAVTSGREEYLVEHQAFSAPNSARNVEPSVNIEGRIFLTNSILSGETGDGGV
tara:strand:- start:3424 stop:6561 length:3138 start_codon:yes stop_codon:yes gene_type:complete